MEKLNIRKMTADDVKEVYEIEKASFSVPWSENLFFEQNKKDIYLPIKIGNYKYLSENILNNVIISFFQSL